MRAKALSLMAMVFFLWALAGAAQPSPAFGPKQYVNTTGEQQTFTDSFQRCGPLGCTIIINNGAQDLSHRISSAIISINGVQVVGPADINSGVGFISRPVTLSAQNEITITLTASAGSYLTITINCPSAPAILSAGLPGASLAGGVLFTALPIANTGTAEADNVQISSISVPGDSLIFPSLPYNVGTIGAGSSSVLNADFTGSFTPGSSLPMTLNGTYSTGNATYCFVLTTELDLPPAAPGSSPLGTVNVPPHIASGPLFPTQPLDFPDDANGPHWTVPVGLFNGGTPTPGGTAVMNAPSGDPPAIDFTVNDSLGLVSGGFNGQAANGGSVEPSGGTGGGVIFVTANWTAAFSMNGGATWKQLDPTAVFQKDAVGFCCDQIVQYVPSINRFVWLLQGNGYRLAVASPADIISSNGRNWTYWNLTPSVFGPTNDNKGSPISFDYPDLGVGNNYLYISWDNGCKNSCDWGHQVARTSLAGLAAGGTIEIDFTHPEDGRSAWGAHLSQDTGDEAYWAGQNSNSQMRIFSMQEGSNFYFWRDVNVASWANNSPITTKTPDGVNWVNFLFNPTTQNPGGGFPNNAVLGVTRNGGNLWFAWSAGTDNNFKQPHVEMVELDRFNNFNVLQQVQIWNNDFGFAYPALATNACTGEVGLSLEYGGNNKYYENHVVGFWGDFVVYVTTDSDVGDNRYGDYVTIRQTPPTGNDPGNLFDAFGYGMNSTTGGGSASDVHWVQFGRPPSFCNRIN